MNIFNKNLIANQMDEIAKLKQLLEQEKALTAKMKQQMVDLYPAITTMQIKKSCWQVQGAVLSFKVEIDVCGEDLHKLVKYLTHRTLSENKYQLIQEEINKGELQ